MRRYAMVGVVVLAALWVGRATAQGGAYAGSGAIGVAAITDYVIEVDGARAVVRGEVTNMSTVPLRNVRVSVWDNDVVEVGVTPGVLAPGQRGTFVVEVEGGPNWHWAASITADVMGGVYGVAATQ